MVVVKCECGASFRLNFSEQDKFIWVCEKCMKRHEHIPEVLIEEDWEEEEGMEDAE